MKKLFVNGNYMGEYKWTAELNEEPCVFRTFCLSGNVFVKIPVEVINTITFGDDDADRIPTEVLTN